MHHRQNPPAGKLRSGVASSTSGAHVARVRDLFEDIFKSEPIDPTDAARRAVRPRLRRRFCACADIDQRDGACSVVLDGRAVKTPAGRILVAPVRTLAQELAAEWQAQAEFVDLATMPLTRLANTIIDGVADNPAAVAAEVAKYLAYDLVCYRAEAPDRLAARQAAAWDPVLGWAHEALGARFIPVTGLAVGAQPASALAAVATAIPCRPPYDPWRLGALHAATTLTGSALIALALAGGALSLDAAWLAAHVDEDWNMEQWGRDQLSLERRGFRFAEMRAAALVLQSGRAAGSAISS
jgi:chaperone required for assembly of F1-ATPase